MAFTFVYVLIIFFIIFSSLNKAKKNNGKHPMNQKPVARASRASSRKTGAGSVRAGSRVHKTEGEYDASILSYCESTLAPGRGMSFHGLKPGTDELALLIKRNQMREKELERAIQAEQYHTH